MNSIKILASKEEITPIADEIRQLNGTTELMDLNTMINNLDEANNEILNQSNLLTQIAVALEGKVAGGCADPVLQEKTATPTTSSQTITPDSGYDGLSKVTVNAMPTATQATPSISVSSAGLITASSTQSAGYVSAGTKSATKQLTTQAAKTITPTTSNQTAVASGRYTTGAITVKGDANLKAANIAKGVSIFGITGTHEGGEDISTETAEYTAQLDELEATIDGLPSGGGGGGSVETCTLSPDATHTTSVSVYYTSYENGEFNANTCRIPKEGAIINNIVKNSCIFFSLGLTKATNMESIHNGDYISGLDGVCYKITGDATYAYYPCFVTGTRITLANGTTKPVEEITYNDELLVWDFDNGYYSTAKPIWIKQEQTASYYYRCTLEDGTILKLVGSNDKCHRLFDLELNRFESATDCVGKMVYTIGGEKKLVSCERIDEEVKFYNIITEYHFNLFAENILTSCRLNNLYPIENMMYVKEERELIPFEAYPDATLGLYKGLRLGERKPEDVSMINEYVNRLIALSTSKEV